MSKPSRQNVVYQRWGYTSTFIPYAQKHNSYPAPAPPRATSSARGFIKKGVQGSDPSVLKDRNVGTCDNRQGTGRG
jgi:hypothetical protein